MIPETLAQKAASAATYGGGGTAFIAGVNANWIAAIGGIVIGVIGLLLNWYYKHKHYKLALKRIEQEFADE
jgi:hypothetical protein